MHFKVITNEHSRVFIMRFKVKKMVEMGFLYPKSHKPNVFATCSGQS
jgi:hypothetical protein